MPDPQVQFDDAPQLLSDKQVAFVLDITIHEVRSLARRKVIRTVRLGGETMYVTESVRPLRRTRTLVETGIGRSRLLSVDDACRELGGISKPRLYDLINGGHIKSVMLGRRRFVTSKSIDDLIRRGNAPMQPQRGEAA